MRIEVLGTLGHETQVLTTRTRRAIELLRLDASLEQVDDPAAIARHGVLATPSLVVDDRVLVAGETPRTKELVGLLAR